MQTVLDGFLDLSRPLVPLALGTCDLAALCREIAALHEGMGRERGVEAIAASGSVPVRCDPRKVKQVLINLVQNAIEASPRGAEVELEAVAGPGGGARVRVLDRGPGVDPALGELVWQPGVTTKATGNGLGLTIARAIARQHGGDLVLAPRDGGGTIAELSLPGTPAARPPA
jgi:signal transduction histidine kinase